MEIEYKRPRNKEIDEAYLNYSKTHFDDRIKSNVKTFLAVVVGAVIIGFNMKVFLNQGNLLPAGINGVAVLIQRLLKAYLGIEIPFWPISFSLNIVPAVIAYKNVGKRFTLYSGLAIVILSFVTDLIPDFTLTYDRLLISVFGGIINGFANSMILRSGASTGGFDFLAIYFGVKKGKSTFNYVLIVNAIVILISGITLGMDSALYTIIYQFVATQVINALYNKYSKKTLLIVSEIPYEVSKAIMETTHHACTVLDGIGTYTGLGKSVIYAVVSANEVFQVRKDIRSIDQHAFINTIDSESITGNFFQRPIG